MITFSLRQNDVGDVVWTYWIRYYCVVRPLGQVANLHCLDRWFSNFMIFRILSIAVFVINPLRAKFFRGNINIYMHFMSLLHIPNGHIRNNDDNIFVKSKRRRPYYWLFARSDGFLSLSTSKARLPCFLLVLTRRRCWKSSRVPVMWNVMKLMWCHSLWCCVVRGVGGMGWGWGEKRGEMKNGWITM